MCVFVGCVGLLGHAYLCVGMRIMLVVLCVPFGLARVCLYENVYVSQLL